MKAYQKIFTGLMLLGTLANAQAVFADEGLSRGEATELVVKYFNLEKKNQDFLNQCKLNPGECLFVFSARTNFDEFRLDPEILYPDVYPAYKYYKSINIASKLDIVSGYFAEDTSPFRPEQKIKKIEALKLAFGASGMLDWKEKFELEGSWLRFGGDKWWYDRYIAEAVQKGLWMSVESDSPDEEISKQDFLKILEKTNTIIANSNDKSSQLDNGRQSDQKANPSANPVLQADSRDGQDL